MSGLETLGIAASIIQVADSCTKLSVRLFSLYRQIKNADESVQLLSNEAALISAILRELGDNLKEEESSKLCSDEAFRTLEHALDQCRDVLRQIESVIKINDRSAQSRLRQTTWKFRLVLLEPSLNPLKKNLESLKSTMLLLLNVIVFTGQVRNQNIPIIQEQRALIETLLEEKENGGTSILPEQHILVKSKATENASPKNPGQSSEFAELDEYNVLIQKMLCEVDFCKSKLEHSRHSRIRKGVLSIHDSEIIRFQLTHGHSVLRRIDKNLLVYENHTPENTDERNPALCAIDGIVRDWDSSSDENTPQRTSRSNSNSSKSPVSGLQSTSPRTSKLAPHEDEKPPRSDSPTIIHEEADRPPQGAKMEGICDHADRKSASGTGSPSLDCGDAREVGHGKKAHPPGDASSRLSRVGVDDLRRLRGTRNASPPLFFGPLSLLGRSRSNGRKKLGPGGNLIRGSEDSAAGSRAAGPPPKEREEEDKKSASSANAFKALADLEDRDNLALSPACNKSELFTSIPPGPEIGQTEPLVCMSDETQELDIRDESFTGDQKIKRADYYQEAEEESHPVSPSTVNSSMALPRNLEELLSRWTKLEQSEIQALGRKP